MGTTTTTPRVATSWGLTAKAGRYNINEAALNEAALNEAALNEAALNEAALNEAALNEATLNEATLNEAGCTGWNNNNNNSDMWACLKVALGFAKP